MKKTALASTLSVCCGSVAATFWLLLTPTSAAKSAPA